MDLWGIALPRDGWKKLPRVLLPRSLPLKEWIYVDPQIKKTHKRLRLFKRYERIKEESLDFLERNG